MSIDLARAYFTDDRAHARSGAGIGGVDCRHQIGVELAKAGTGDEVLGGAIALALDVEQAAHIEALPRRRQHSQGGVDGIADVTPHRAGGLVGFEGSLVRRRCWL